MRLFILSLFLTSILFAGSFSTRYDVSVGMFGKVGYADVTILEDNTHYEMKLVATMTGTAASLSGNRIETYISEGEIRDGRYLPNRFTKIKNTDRIERIQSYSFDHTKGEVFLIQEESRLVNESSFDPIAFKLVKREVKKHSRSESTLEHYSEQDVLSSYLNTAKSCNAQNREYNLIAIGAHNDEKDVTLSFLDGLERERVTSSFSKDIGNIYNLKIQPLDKDEQKVDVLVALDSDGHLKEALLADIFWIGEVKATRVYHRVSRNEAF